METCVCVRVCVQYVCNVCLKREIEWEIELVMIRMMRDYAESGGHRVFFRACEGNRCFDVFVRVESGGDRDDERL